MMAVYKSPRHCISNSQQSNNNLCFFKKTARRSFEKIKQSLSEPVLSLYLAVGDVPVRVVDGHAVLPAAPGPDADGGAGRDPPFPADHRGCRGSRHKERRHSLLGPGKT